MLALGLAGCAEAQTVQVKGYADAGLSLQNRTSATPGGALTLSGQLNLNLSAQPWTVVSTLNPYAALLSPAGGDFGLAEAYVQYRQGTVQAALGVQRTVVEVARLGLPYVLDRVDTVTQAHLGRPTLSLGWTPERWRTRLVLIADHQGVMPVLSVRHEFSQAEAEGHVLWRNGALEVGLGGSGTFGPSVLYGEVWGLHNLTEGRFAAGVSGNLPNSRGLWTLETGRAPALPGQATPATFYLSGQATVALSDEQNLALTASAWPVNPAGAATLTYTSARDDNEFRAFFTGTWMNGQPGFGLGVNFRRYFAWATPD